MDAPLSPNPARNPGAGKYEKDFLLSFRHVFVGRPPDWDEKLTRAGLACPTATAQLATPPDRRVPSIAVTPPGEGEASTPCPRRTRGGRALGLASWREKTFATATTQQTRESTVAHIQKRTVERLRIKEVELQQQYLDLDYKQAELEYREQELAEEKARVHRCWLDEQSVQNDKRWQLRVGTDYLEKARLDHLVLVLTEKAQLEKEKKAFTDVQAGAIKSQARLEKVRDRTVAAAKLALALFQIGTNISAELNQRVLATLEAEIIALEGQSQSQFQAAGAQHGADSSREPQSALPANHLAAPRANMSGMILITGVPRGIQQDEVNCAVRSMSGSAIRVYSVVPGMPTQIALAYFVGCPARFFEGSFYVAKDSEMQAVGKVRLHFMILNL